ncbi:NUDIX hydrolase [Aspergillus stella-maris]|uniref:NUDIX hydrolase n=1 Tax=Aspergillus stella-maris TaxID=1810926 RepID=UPI003CCE53FB
MSATDNSLSQRQTSTKPQRAGTMGILVSEKGGKVLLLHRREKTPEVPKNGNPDSWAFPGGGVDAGETPEQAIVREFREEVGLDVKIVPFGNEFVLGQVDDVLEHGFWRCSFFVVKQTNPSQKPELKEPHKHVEFAWVDWNVMWGLIEGQIDFEAKNGTSKGMEGMRFFLSMVNMVKKYPGRSNVACLEYWPVGPSPFCCLLQLCLSKIPFLWWL